MVEIGGKPILWHIMKFYASQGFKDFILCLGYKKEKIIEYFEENPESKMNIEFIDTGDGSTTKSDRIRKIKEMIDEDNFLLAYGDDVSDVILDEVIKVHNNKGSIVTITTVNPISNFGIIDIDKDNYITGFIEKPKIKDQWINAGFAVINKKLFDYLDIGELEDKVYKKLATEKNISAYKHEGFWMGMNTFKDQLELQELWKTKKCPWRIWKDE
jgi:glucose-1-phosphate cytidylyltransferase